MQELEQFAQLGGTVVVVISFLYYMKEQNKEFNKTIQNHMEHSNKAIDKNSDVIVRITKTLQELCMIVRKSNKGEQGLRGHKGQRGLQGIQGEDGE